MSGCMCTGRCRLTGRCDARDGFGGFFDLPKRHVCERFKPAEAKAIEMRDKVLKGIWA